MNKLKVLNRNQLKYIAMILMLCDHIGAAFCEQGTTAWYILRYVCGRTSFPIFCVLFVEGIYFTKRPLVHLRDCFIFALLSEIPFDMAFSGKSFDFANQNVMWTWFLGLFMCLMLREILKYGEDSKNKKNADFSENVCLLACFVICILFCILAYLCRVDYTSVGICIIFFFFMVGYRTKFNCDYIVFGIIVAVIDGICSLTFWTFPAVLILFLYDNKKCVNTSALQKYSFYVFYPLHLFIIGLFVMYVF